MIFMQGHWIPTLLFIHLAWSRILTQLMHIFHPRWQVMSLNILCTLFTFISPSALLLPNNPINLKLTMIWRERIIFQQTKLTVHCSVLTEWHIPGPRPSSLSPRSAVPISVTTEQYKMTTRFPYIHSSVDIYTKWELSAFEFDIVPCSYESNCLRAPPPVLFHSLQLFSPFQHQKSGWWVVGLGGFSGYLSCSLILSIFIVTLLLSSSL